jgi:hypothetical protein
MMVFHRSSLRPVVEFSAFQTIIKKRQIEKKNTNLWSFPEYKSCKNCFSLPGLFISLMSGNRYMCRNESMAINGKSDRLFPRWCSGCSNFLPSAVKKFTLSIENHKYKTKITHYYYKYWRFSDNNSFTTISLYCFTEFVSPGAWNKIRNGNPSSVNSSAFSNVISLTNGTQFSWTQMCVSSKSFKFPIKVTSCSLVLNLSARKTIIGWPTGIKYEVNC